LTAAPPPQGRERRREGTAAATAREAGRRPRLAYITTEGSTLRYLMRGQLAYLRTEGFEVHLISQPDADLAAVASREQVAATGVPMRRGVSPARDLLTLRRLVPELRRIAPQVVNASTPKAGLLGTLAAYLAGVRVRIYTLRGLRLETTRGLARAVLTRSERTTAAAATQVICVSQSLRRRALELRLTDAAKALVLGRGSSNGVDVERFRPPEPGEPTCGSLRRELGIPPAAPVIGFVGRLSRDKGIEDVAELFFERLANEVPEAFLLLLGRLDRASPPDPRLLERLRAHPRVLHAGFSDDIAPHYRLMDVLAFPSYREGFPNAPLEAAASEVPVAGYAVTGTVDAVEHGVTGTLVPRGDRAALARAILAYLGRSELRREHGRAGRERARRDFRQELVWRAWAGTYRRLLAGVEAADAP
jgi:glycosyltransferase involved in cell wall biosynthesis